METVVQCQAYIRRRLQAPGYLVVETNDKHCDVSQEEEYDDDCLKVNLSDTDHEGARRCASSDNWDDGRKRLVVKLRFFNTLL